MPLTIRVEGASGPSITTISVGNGQLEMINSASTQLEPVVSTILVPLGQSQPPATSAATSHDPSPTGGLMMVPSTIVTFLTTTTPSATSTAIISATSSTTIFHASNSTSRHMMNTWKVVAAILIPVLVILVMFATVYVCCRVRRRKRFQRRGLQDKPHELQILRSLKETFTLPWRQVDPDIKAARMSQLPELLLSRSRSSSTNSEMGMQSTLYPPRKQQPENNGLDPPPPYAPNSDRLRPPSEYGRVRTRSPTLSEVDLSDRDDLSLRSPRLVHGSPLLDQDDNVSEISFDSRSNAGGPRARDADEISFVSALEYEEHDEREMHNMV